jgi:hypothetical protein
MVSLLSQLSPALPRDIVLAIEEFQADKRLHHIQQNSPSKGSTDNVETNTVHNSELGLGGAVLSLAMVN